MAPNDPHRILKGSGNRVRRVMLEGAADLDKSEIRALVAKTRRRMIVKAISKKQRSRLPRPIEALLPARAGRRWPKAG